MMGSGARLAVTIVGGGASGVLLAAHLLRSPEVDVRVTLIERGGRVGQGVAYSTAQTDHLLNVPASGMSAFADQPDHFWRWLQDRGEATGENSYTFVPRRLYGDYLADLLHGVSQSHPGRLNVVSAGVSSVRETARGVDVLLDNGTSIASHVAVLAVGHETLPSRGKGLAVRVGSTRDTPLPRDCAVMILGSGLSMVDAWLALSAADHAGPVYVVSRNGRLPQSHRQCTPLGIDAADVPLGTNALYFTRWFRGLVAAQTAAGGDWRSVVDGLRPYNQRIWQNWSRGSRRQFLRFLRPFWNIHRHRLPPQLHQRLQEAVASGQVQLIAGEFLDIAGNSEAVRATIRRRGQSIRETVDVARVYDCGGVSVDVAASSNPVIADLVAHGVGRPDPLSIGLDVDNHCAVVGEDGKPSSRLFAVGPLTRGRFFEIEAIPDIRLQCAALARHLTVGSTRQQPAAGQA